MAENRPRTKPKEREQPTRRSSSPKQIPINFKGISSFFRSREFQFVMGILMICMAIFLFVSLLSHIFTGHDDQTETLSNGDWQESGRSIRNIFGLFGATLARVMVLDLFGWAAFFFVPVLLGVGVKISFKKDLFSLENLTWQVLFFVFWFSSFFGFFLASSPGSGAVLSEFSGGVGKTIGDVLFAITGWGGL